MINSLFVINNVGDIFVEKHWKSVISRSVCDHFFEALSKANSPEDVPPVIAAPHHYLIIPPLFVIEFLHRVVDTFTEYFNSCTEASIKEHVVIVFELLEEMLDNGFPLATEPNILRELINPPSIVRQVVNTVTGGSHVSSHLPTGQLSNVPWRRTGVKYTHNEVYFDVVEEIDCIIDKHQDINNCTCPYHILPMVLIYPRVLNLSPDIFIYHQQGSTVFTEIQGVVRFFFGFAFCWTLPFTMMNSYSSTGNLFVFILQIDSCCKLSGMPDLSLCFVNSRLLEDPSFHPCVRLKRWESEKVLSFVPPDGNYRLLSYHITTGTVAIPVYAKPQVTYNEVEDVVVTVPFPKQVLNVNLTPSNKIILFFEEVGKILPQKLPNLRGSIQFKISQLAASGLKVSRLDIYGEKYKPFKGVKYVTKAGKFQIRL
ncbi:AP-3 complex subunit mu-1 [Acropora cervicornis]|uniref:AP-3 complex subunit mu-1 n=1 Tax=Acropora cervicornis TaxID=6130 RepID=A0AAD9QRJ0_ACRCE|nr:AP-3 complex subunit mu-1 [Acropora cervicornis]